MHEKDIDIDFDLNSKDDELTEKNKKQKNNSLSIEKLKKGLGYGPAPGAGNSDLNLNLNLNIDNIIEEKNNNNNNLGIIKKPLNILVFDGANSIAINRVSNAILNNGTQSNQAFSKDKVFCGYPVAGSGGAQITRVLCDGLSVQAGNDFKKLREGNVKVEDYDVIVVAGLNQTSDKDVLDFVANKIKNGEDNNLIVYGDNWLSNGKNMNWFKYHLKYEFFCKELLSKIASFDKDSKKFVGWEGQEKDNLDYEQNKFEGLKGAVGEMDDSNIHKDDVHKHSFSSSASEIALKGLKNHYGKIATVFLLLEEIFYGKIRKNLSKIFKSKEVKNQNKDKKGAEDNKNLNNDAKKEKTL